MARISHFERADLKRLALHDPVDAQLFTYEVDGKRLMQINTVGRKSRTLPGKVSQSIQLDEQGATELFAALKSHFGLR